MDKHVDALEALDRLNFNHKIRKSIKQDGSVV